MIGNYERSAGFSGSKVKLFEDVTDHFTRVLKG